MKTVVLVAILVVLLVVPAIAYDWAVSPVNGHRYTLVNGSSWSDAEAQAVLLGGHLATIRNTEENDWLQPWLATITGPTQWWAWIGLYQLPNSPEPAGGWVWVSGEPVTFTHWSPGEPNDYYGHGNPENWCGYYIRVQAPDREFPMYWLDVVDIPSVGIVEVVPEPSSLLMLSTCIATLGYLVRRRLRPDAVRRLCPEEGSARREKRMKTFALIALLFSMLALPVFAYDWITSPVNGHRYTLVDCSSWTDAENQAISMGGHLATIRSEAENTWVHQFTYNNKASCYRAWLGLYKPEGATGPDYGWKWSSGEAIIYTNWIWWMDPVNMYDYCFMFIRAHEQSDPPTIWAPEGNTANPWIMTTGIVELVPEPSGLFALCGGIMGLLALRRWRK